MTTGTKTTLCGTGYTEEDLYNPRRDILNVPLLMFACYGNLDAPNYVATGATGAKVYQNAVSREIN